LFLLVTKAGGKHWKLKYTSPVTNKENTYPIGIYPSVTLIDARFKREELRKLISEGVDPKLQEKIEKEQQKSEIKRNINTFKKVALEWHKSHKSHVSENYHQKQLRMLELHLLPTFADTPIAAIKRADFSTLLQSIKESGKDETARRVKTMANVVFEYAVEFEYLEINPIGGANFKRVLGKKVVKHYPNVKDPKAVLKAIDGYKGYFVKKALQIAPYLALRVENVAWMQWEWVDFEKQLLHIPKEFMKIPANGDHILPLSNQAFKILEELYGNRLSDIYVFPSDKHKDEPLAKDTPRMAYRRMGFSSDELTFHSWRILFSTTCNEHAKEHNFDTKDIVEVLLHHKNADKVRMAYNRATYEEDKRELIQWYGDFLDRSYR